MDTRTTIINNTINGLQAQLSPEQLQSLKNTLYIQLNNYEVQERCTALEVIDDSPEKLMKRFIATKRIEGKAESTLQRYSEICLPMLHALNKPVKDITTFDLRYYLANYKETRDVSNRTLDGMRKCFSSFFNWLFIEELIPKNPAAALAQIKYDKKVLHPYSSVDMEKVKRSCENSRDRALVEFLYSTGCRVSEVSRLNRDNINWAEGTAVVFGKGSKERIVYLNDVAVYYLQEYINSRTDSDPCLFASLKTPHKRITKNGIEARLHKLGMAANVDDVHPHRYRRTLATNLIDRGVSIQDVATILGHEDITTTQIYCYISQKNVENSYRKYA